MREIVKYMRQFRKSRKFQYNESKSQNNKILK